MTMTLAGDFNDYLHMTMTIISYFNSHLHLQIVVFVSFYSISIKERKIFSLLHEFLRLQIWIMPCKYLYLHLLFTIKKVTL